MFLGCLYCKQYEPWSDCSLSHKQENSLLICLQVLSADNLCKQFGPRSGPTDHLAWSGLKLFATLMVFKKKESKKLILKKVRSWQNSVKNYPVCKEIKLNFMVNTKIIKNISLNIIFTIFCMLMSSAGNFRQYMLSGTRSDQFLIKTVWLNGSWENFLEMLNLKKKQSADENKSMLHSMFDPYYCIVILFLKTLEKILLMN